MLVADLFTISGMLHTWISANTTVCSAFINVKFSRLKYNLSVSVSVYCRTNTGINAAGERERRSPAPSRTDCLLSIPGTL